MKNKLYSILRKYFADFLNLEPFSRVITLVILVSFLGFLVYTIQRFIWVFLLIGLFWAVAWMYIFRRTHHIFTDGPEFATNVILNGLVQEKIIDISSRRFNQTDTAFDNNFFVDSKTLSSAITTVKLGRNEIGIDKISDNVLTLEAQEFLEHYLSDSAERTDFQVSRVTLKDLDSHLEIKFTFLKRKNVKMLERSKVSQANFKDGDFG